MFGGVGPAAGVVSSRRAANEPTTNNHYIRGSLRLADSHLQRPSNTPRQLSRPKSSDSSEATDSLDGDTICESDYTGSKLPSFDKSLLEGFVQERPTLGHTQQPQGNRHREEHYSWRGEDWSDSDSDCSVVSETSTTDVAAFRDHNAEQFSKILPRNAPIKVASPPGLRKTLSRKVGFQNLSGAAKARPGCCHADSISTQDPIEVINFNSNDVVSQVRPVEAIAKTSFRQSSNETKPQPVTLKPSVRQSPSEANPQPEILKTSIRQSLNEIKPPSAILPQNLPKRSIPQGHALRVAQLNLQEKILSRIAEQVITAKQEASVRGRVKGRVTSIATRPDYRDRELEITQELMKRVRVAIHDESYEDICFSAKAWKDGAQNDKWEILCTIMLVLRFAFGEMIEVLGRPYRPTGYPITDREVVEEMEAHLIAQRDLERPDPRPTLEELLRSVDIDKDEAD